MVLLQVEIFLVFHLSINQSVYILLIGTRLFIEDGMVNIY